MPALRLLAITTALALIGALPAPAADAAPPVGRPARGHVVHRVVWGPSGQGGVRVWSARRDGSDRRLLYRDPTGFYAGSLVLDRRGARVAFSPTTRDRRRATLFVVSVFGGPARDVLADQPAFTGAGGIGWSPAGRHLVFEGTVRHGSRYVTDLWRIDPDGTHLHRITDYRRPAEQGDFYDESVAWSSEGIVFSHGGDLQVYDGHRTRMILKTARSPAISGDGRWLTIYRDIGEGQIWFSHPDGTALREITPILVPHSSVSLVAIHPSYDGSRLIGQRDETSHGHFLDRFVAWDTRRDPATYDHVFGFASGDVSWN